MAQETINVGATPNDGSGDPLRTAFEKCNNNFTELYSTSFTPARISNGASSVNIPQGDGNIEITVNDTPNTVLITQNATYISGAMTATGNIYGANLRTSGVMSAAGNVNGSNVISAGIVSAAGNVTGSNVNAGANVYATTHTGATASLSGTAQVGNLLTVGQISATGNVTGNYFIGDGGLLSNVTVVSNVAVSQIANGSSIISIVGSAGNATVSIGGVANIAVFSTSGVTIGGLISATGNVRSGNLTTGGVCQATGNVSGGNLVTGGIVSSAGNVIGGNLVTAGFILSSGNLTSGNVVTTGVVSAGSATSAGNVDAGNLRTSGVISATGNITGAYVLGDGSQLTNVSTSLIQNGTSNARVVSSGGNVTVNVGGTSNVAVFATTGAYISGLISATGTITGGNLSGTNISGTLTSGSQNNITSVGTLTSLNSGTISSSGNITGANLITSGLLSATGNIRAGNLLSDGIISSTGNITASNLSVATGTVTLNNIVNGGTSATGNIGTSSTPFNTVFAKATSAQYADLAEYYVSDYNYEAGTVVRFGGEFEVTLSLSDADPEIAGVISACPAYAMNTGVEGEYTLAVALQGRVPCKVQGPVRKGQMMVSAGDGYARAELHPAIGTVIGKALENFDGDQGIIEVVVGRV
jgi:hypothetical protein